MIVLRLTKTEGLPKRPSVLCISVKKYVFFIAVFTFLNGYVII